MLAGSENVWVDRKCRRTARTTRLTRLGHPPASHVAVAKPVSPLSKCSSEPLRCQLPSLEADMRRREFLGVLGGVAVAWPVVARAQQSEPMRRVGFLRVGPPPPAFIDGFRQGMRERGLIEG